jgi:pimeloyl-ACP methyl ester carboxylesterase
MQPLLLLHGAIGASDQLLPLARRLERKYQVCTLDFTGHGSRPNADVAFSVDLFADDVLQFLPHKGLEEVSIFGYSMGGYVAMYLAKNFPEKVTKVVTLATKYHWDPDIAAKEIQMLNPGKIEQKLPAFAETLRRRHAPNDWKKVLHKTAEMMIALGDDNPLKAGNYATIAAPVLMLLGDRDKMVTLDETIAVYKSLPNAQLGILPGTPHPIEQANVDSLAFMIEQFCG